MAGGVHVDLVAHSKEGERDRGAPGIEHIKGAMELGANAFNIVSVWRNRKLEDEISSRRRCGGRGLRRPRKLRAVPLDR
jgi:twinkle protein